MRSPIAVILLSLPLLLIPSCSDDPAAKNEEKGGSGTPVANDVQGTSFHLMVGEKSVGLSAGGGPGKVRESVIKELKPVWDGLQTGSASPLFFLHSKSAGLTSAKWRFFKDADGTAGLEVLQTEADKLPADSPHKATGLFRRKVAGPWEKVQASLADSLGDAVIAQFAGS